MHHRRWWCWPNPIAHEALKRCENIDIIVKGEGEPVLKHLIPAVLSRGDFSERSIHCLSKRWTGARKSEALSGQG